MSIDNRTRNMERTNEGIVRHLLKTHEDYVFLGSKDPKDHALIISRFKDARREILHRLGM